jgi:hypothetical protein
MNGNYKRQEAYFFLLPRPKVFRGGGGQAWNGVAGASCPNEEPLRLKVWLEPLAGQIVMLKDNTFLLADMAHRVVLRITEDLDSQSTLINKTIFHFPTADTFLMDRLMVKSYGLPDDETAPVSQAIYQEALDDLHKLATELRARKKPPTRYVEHPLVQLPSSSRLPE